MRTAELTAALRLNKAGRLGDAETACRRSLALRANDPTACDLLAGIVYQRGRAGEALELAGRAVALAPAEPAYRVKLGALLCSAGRPADALAFLSEALPAGERIPELHNNLAIALKQLGRLEEAIASFRKATTLRPDYAEAHFNLGGALRKDGRPGDALAAYERVIALWPGFAAAYAAMADAYGDQARQDEAIACQRRALGLGPQNGAANGDLLFTLHYSPKFSPAQQLEKAKQWGRRNGSMVKALPAPDNDRTPGRRLRIGYLSPDFRAHTLAHFIEPLLPAHDRSQFEVYCYSAVIQPDPVTDRLRKLADVWRDVRELEDDSAARLVRQDGIDILVDLAGHMGGSRLRVLARRPAPVQVQVYYAGTTGLPAVDYRITDNYSDPPGADAFYTERLIRLPDCAWVYRPSDGSPEVGPLPAAATGHVTLGCLNKPIKITEQAVELWRRIMQAVPGSRLLLLSPTENPALLGQFTARGIDAGRVELASRRRRREYLELFNRIDIALDPFPYNGDTTTCDGFWMGVPLVTLAGQAFVSRRGVSHLCNVGLSELVASSEDDYVRIATALANDLPRLAHLRRGWRERMAGSPLMDYTRYTANLEAAYRRMWRQWCRMT